MFTRTALCAAATFFAATTAHAAVDLRVSIPQSMTPHVYESMPYTVVVTNTGTSLAWGVRLTVQLPGISPSSSGKLLMGELSGIDPRCKRKGTQLVCQLGTMTGNAVKSVGFDFELPEIDHPVTISAAVSSAVIDAKPTNNITAFTPAPLHYAVPLDEGVTAGVEQCSGSHLASFFECTLHPESITEFELSFDPSGDLGLEGRPDYVGSWTQTPEGELATDPEYLAFAIFDEDVPVIDFEGYGVSPDCFEGIAILGDSEEVSAYRICV